MAERSTSHRIRLNKYLADCGIASRRKADEMIENGEVTINGKKVFELGIRVDPKVDRILFRGKPVQAQNRFVYYAFYKPKSVVTTTDDPHGRVTVLDYFKKSTLRLFPVGRLDFDAEGLLLITNDGEFAQKVIHPDEHVSKTYHVKLDGIPTDPQIEKLRRGVSIVGGKVSALFVKRLPKTTDKKAWVEVVIDEGKNHQVKQMFAKIGFDVVKLRRVAIGEFRIGSLKPGEYRELTFEQIHKIFKRRSKVKKDNQDSKDKNAVKFV
ncbi:rRNA pseudouridine synthase [bacterium]|nr:rRNA pseudouridine synthase [bacterium]